MKEEETKSYTIEEIKEVALAMTDGIDSCETIQEESLFFQEFPYTGKYNEELSMLIASIFMTGMMHTAVSFIRKEELAIQRNTLCQN